MLRQLNSSCCWVAIFHSRNSKFQGEGNYPRYPLAMGLGDKCDFRAAYRMVSVESADYLYTVCYSDEILPKKSDCTII